MRFNPAGGASAACLSQGGGVSACSDAAATAVTVWACSGRQRSTFA